MMLLALDTSANLCAACVYDTQTHGVLGAVTRDLGKGHAEHLIAVIDEALARAGVIYAGIGCIAVTTGPGSFTGVRVGVSAARGLALALRLPCTGVSTLEALAAQARADYPGKPVLAVLDARQGDIYAALFDATGNERVAPHVTSAVAAATLATGQTVLAGSGADAVAALADQVPIIGREGPVSIEVIAALAAAKPRTDQKPKPVYMRAFDAKIQAGFALPRKAG